MPCRPVVKRPRWQRRPDARPEEILDAAVEVFGEQGYANTRLDAVARRAGVSKGTLYLYFESKDALFRAMMTAKLESKLASAEQLIRTWQGTNAELLRTFVAAYWETVNQPQTVKLVKLVMSELANFPGLAKWHYQEVVLRLRAVIEEILRRGAANGEFRVVNLSFAARTLQNICTQAAQFRHYLQPYDAVPMTSEQMLEGILDLYFHGVLAAPDRPVTGP